MSKKIVILMGGPGVGKSTFVDLCVTLNEHDYFDGHRNHLTLHEASMVDGVKEIAKRCGWDEQKTPINRDGLANLKTLLDNWLDFPFQDVLNDIMGIPEQRKMDHIVFIHCREFKDAARFFSTFRKNSYLVWVKRDNSDVVQDTITNVADALALSEAEECFEYCKKHNIGAYTIDNNASKADLRDEAEAFVKDILGDADE